MSALSSLAILRSNDALGKHIYTYIRGIGWLGG